MWLLGVLAGWVGADKTASSVILVKVGSSLARSVLLKSILWRVSGVPQAQRAFPAGTQEYSCHSSGATRLKPDHVIGPGWRGVDVHLTPDWPSNPGVCAASSPL